MTLIPKSSLIADVDTSNCESAVDIIAATAPDINKPANQPGNKVCANKGIIISGSFPMKKSSPK